MPLNQLVAYKIIWLEHLTVNQRVLGSSPRGGAKLDLSAKQKSLREIGGFFF